MRSIAALLLTSTLANAQPFVETFDQLDRSRWVVANWQAPGNEPRNHQGAFSSDYVDIVDGMLRIRLTQQRDVRGNYYSLGGEIVSTRQFGYGTYRFRMRAGSTAQDAYDDGQMLAGGVSAAFLYNAERNTEIDIEFEGAAPEATHLLSWQNSNYRDNQHTKRTLDYKAPYQEFFTYQIDWEPGVVRYYRDGELIAEHRNVVPEQPANFVFNHWGSNNQWWGGWATPDVDRYMYVDFLMYRPLTSE